MNKPKHGRKHALFPTVETTNSSPSSSAHQRRTSSSANICPTCEKSFERLYNLKVHLRKHTGETPYDCPVTNCRKQFKWRSSMAHHVRAHHNSSELITTNLSASSVQSVASAAISKSASSKKRGQKKGSGKGSVCSLKLTGVKKESKKPIHFPVNKSEDTLKPPSTPTTETPDDNDVSLDSALSSSPPLQMSDNSLDEAFLLFNTESEEILDSICGLISREIGSAIPNADPIIDLDLPTDTLDHGMSFLASGSDDVTDAEMECLAQFEGHLLSPEGSPSPPPQIDVLDLP